MKHTLLTLSIAAALAACSTPPHTTAATPTTSQTATGSLAIETTRGVVNINPNPQRVAVYDWGMLDTLTQLGVKVGATTDTQSLPIIPNAADTSSMHIVQNAVADAVRVGTLFKPNYEALRVYQPQLIITGSRTAEVYDELKQIAPTLEMTADTQSMRAGTEQRIDQFAAIFGKQAQAAQLKNRIDQAIRAAQAAAQGKGNGLVLIVNADKIYAVAPDSRVGSWIYRDVGIPMADATIPSGGRGKEVSFDDIKRINPDWLFVLDRNAAVSNANQATTAAQTLNNPLVRDTTAAQKGQIVYLLPTTYLAAGGAGSFIESLQHLTQALSGNTAR